jgi:hypothetical protein
VGERKNGGQSEYIRIRHQIGYIPTNYLPAFAANRTVNSYKKIRNKAAANDAPINEGYIKPEIVVFANAMLKVFMKQN